ncbi:hypothetical protein VTN00DRAFT_5882 [Thermoascus crustaceus]|uniref:uncharacterized protein n=1 Tax=Thermoascus crustaceus TaxID=5088 RepID=UPI00374241A0
MAKRQNGPPVRRGWRFELAGHRVAGEGRPLEGQRLIAKDFGGFDLKDVIGQKRIGDTTVSIRQDENLVGAQAGCG